MGLVGHPLSTLAVLAALHPHTRASGVDYLGVFVAATVSWVALPGPGEAALIAAGISAAHHHLDLASVLAVAWAGACLGGTAGWLVGGGGGPGFLSAPAPLRPLPLPLVAARHRFYGPCGLSAGFVGPPWAGRICPLTVC